ncbi:hypothetical protein MKW94_028162 [Papaver nudicaule]|uniref:Uncharacterized protein n=1 Tax=Papaver nudicaule TaxID=74823 RepID=A0AA41VDQ8_PAPNU|nr:hypothetical protein [Papaver nudicaule]
MENFIGSSSKGKRVLLAGPPVQKVSELEGLQNQYIEKESKIQELKKEKESKIQELKKDMELVKRRLEKIKQEVLTDNMEAVKALTDEFHRLKFEYQSLLNESGNLG